LSEGKDLEKNSMRGLWPRILFCKNMPTDEDMLNDFKYAEAAKQQRHI